MLSLLTIHNSQYLYTVVLGRYRMAGQTVLAAQQHRQFKSGSHFMRCAHGTLQSTTQNNTMNYVKAARSHGENPTKCENHMQENNSNITSEREWESDWSESNSVTDTFCASLANGNGKKLNLLLLCTRTRMKIMSKVHIALNRSKPFSRVFLSNAFSSLLFPVWSNFFLFSISLRCVGTLGSDAQYTHTQ